MQKSSFGRFPSETRNVAKIAKIYLDFQTQMDNSSPIIVVVFGQKKYFQSFTQPHAIKKVEIHKKMVKMVPNGPKLWKIVKVVQNGQNCQIGQNGPNWSKMVQIGKNGQKFQNSQKWSNTV